MWALSFCFIIIIITCFFCFDFALVPFTAVMLLILQNY